MGGFALPILDFLPQALVASSEHVQVKIQKLGHSRRFLIGQPRVGSAASQIRQGVETRVFGGIRTVAVVVTVLTVIHDKDSVGEKECQHPLVFRQRTWSTFFQHLSRPNVRTSRSVTDIGAPSLSFLEHGQHMA